MQQRTQLENQRLEEDFKLKKIADDEAKKIATMEANTLARSLLSANSFLSTNSKLVAQSESAVVANLKGELAYQHLQMRLQAQRYEFEVNKLQNENSRLFFLSSYNS